MGKAAIAAISLVLVVGVVIGAVVVVKHRNSNDTGASGGGNGSGIMTGMKALDTLCSPTHADHKDLCVETLSPVVKGDANASPRAFVEATFQATMKAVQNALIESNSLDKDVKDEYDASTLEICKRYIGYAAEDLETAMLDMVPEINMTKMGSLARELKIILSAVLSYTSTCVEMTENPKMKEALEGGVLLNTTKLAENGLGIIDGVAEFLDNLNVDILESTGKKPQRRLLDLGNDEHPSWLSASDRKLLQANEKPSPNVIVAQDGSGQFNTIQAAVNSYFPKKHKGRFVIHVKKGVYHENVVIRSEMRNIYMYGDGPQETIVTSDKSVGIIKVGTTKTPMTETATFSVFANRFIAKSMGFHNTAGIKGLQALAVLTKAKYIAFYDCVMDGYQDTLHYLANESFFRKCVISGTIDFIFGKGDAFIQNSNIIVKLPNVTLGQLNMITADGNNNVKKPTGLVIQNCTITGEPALIAHKTKITYLGRPWGESARTVIMQSNLPDFILPEGYSPWNQSSSKHLTSHYKEFANSGPGAVTAGRVKWPNFEAANVIDEVKMGHFTAENWITGKKWLPGTGIPYYLGFH